VSTDEARRHGASQWRLRNPHGELMHCYMDRVGSKGHWIITIWRNSQLLMTKLYMQREVASAACTTIRERMLAEGWSDCPMSD
jgi:hypothetical protein